MQAETDTCFRNIHVRRKSRIHRLCAVGPQKRCFLSFGGCRGQPSPLPQFLHRYLDAISVPERDCNCDNAPGRADEQRTADPMSLLSGTLILLFMTHVDLSGPGDADIVPAAPVR